MLFNGVFNDLTVSQACALLSCFVFQEKANDMPKLPSELSGPLRLLQVCLINSNIKLIDDIFSFRKLHVELLEYQSRVKSKWMKNGMSMDLNHL